MESLQFEDDLGQLYFVDLRFPDRSQETESQPHYAEPQQLSLDHASYEPQLPGVSLDLIQ